MDEFFELSVLESDSRSVELCKLDIISFLSEFILENETLIRNHELTPEITFPEKTVFVQANKELLSRIFSNLMGNILKYAKDSFELSVQDINSSDKKSCRIRIGNKVENPAAIHGIPV